MADRKTSSQATPEMSGAWRELPWRKLEKHVYRIQKRIYRASQRGNHRQVEKLQKLLLKSEAARLLAVRRVTQDNQGKKTAGVDGVKSVPPKERFLMVKELHTKRWNNRKKPQPVRRVWLPKPGKAEKRPLGIPTMMERAKQALVRMALEPAWEAVFEPNSYGFRPGRSAHDAIGAIFLGIRYKPKFVFDADIKGCFDHIDHEALLRKLNTYPKLTHLIRGWCNYHRWVVCSKAFNRCRHRVYQQLGRWERTRHPGKTWEWVNKRYQKRIDGQTRFGVYTKDKEGNPRLIYVRNHEETHATERLVLFTTDRTLRSRMR
jgi:retron-type reverse transcriptase